MANASPIVGNVVVIPMRYVIRDHVVMTRNTLISLMIV